MTTLPEPNLYWTDHYVKYGVAVLHGMLDKNYIAEALDEVKRLVGTKLPLEEWNSSNIPKTSYAIPRGNNTIWQGTHKLVQKHVMDDPDWQYPKNWSDIPEAEPFEFVPKAGDVMFFHHLVAHEGNPCCTRMPRISLHCQGLRDEWLEE